MLEAWLNLSHREKARVLVMVKVMAMTAAHVSIQLEHQRHGPPAGIDTTATQYTKRLTDKRQPDELEPDQRQHGQGDQAPHAVSASTSRRTLRCRHCGRGATSQ